MARYRGQPDERATFQYSRTVLAVGRTVTSTARLLDVLPLLERDRRVQTVFTIAPGSGFSDGVAALLSRAGAKVVPWERAVEARYDLAISASANGDLHLLKAPLLLIPHGAGHNKLLGRSGQVSGLAREQLVHNGKVTPSVIALSHSDQLGTVARTCPEARDRAVVVGDPCHDRMRASEWARWRYREDLGVGDRHLVLVSSTWGPESLFGTTRDLPERLARELPVDEYLVVVAVHPNVEDFHGTRQLESWLGVGFLPPHTGWQAALIAADTVIGDHGSLALYATAMGVPVLLGAFADSEIAPGSPMAELGALAARLDHDRPIRPQLDDLVAWQDVARRTFDQRGEAAARLRRLMYRLLGLDEPATPAELPALPSPVPRLAEPPSYFVASRCLDGNIVELERFPTHELVSELPGRHIVATREAGLRQLQAAGVLLLPEDADPARWLAEHPACGVVGVVTGPRTCLVWLRDGRRLRMTTSGGPADLLPSAVHAWVSSGRVAEELKRGLRVNGTSVEAC
ncbi:hypothetical protein [Allokutzneria oryzae]|uniref:Translation initiation factor 2 n=1 Tax=Allokutzneria oryzae TaxID=1378989 RepID=A0ABV6A858_9PSEU